MSAASESDVSKKRSDNSEEEAEEDVSLEENAFERVQQLRALHDSILKMIPANEPYLNDKIIKRKEGTENEPKTRDESPVMKNVWMKTMIAQTKNIDLLNNNLRIEEEDNENMGVKKSNLNLLVMSLKNLLLRSNRKRN